MVNEPSEPATRSWPDRIAAGSNLIIALVCGIIAVLLLVLIVPKLGTPPSSIGEGEGQMVLLATGIIGLGVSAFCVLVMVSFLRRWRIRWWLQALPVPVLAWAWWETRMPSCCDCPRTCDSGAPWGWLALVVVGAALVVVGIRRWRRQVRGR